MKQLKYGSQDKVVSGSGVELTNGLGNLKTCMKYNKNGHIVMYNTSVRILSNLYGGIIYVPISILSRNA